eukprot:197447-Prorocentrum_lima.AAC.1
MRAGTRPDKWCCDDPHDALQPPPHLHIRACAQDTAPTCRAHVRFSNCMQRSVRTRAPWLH